MWIVVVPPDDVGGPLKVVCGNGTKLSARPDAWPTGWSDRREAQMVARKFRCGIVVEEKRGKWMLRETMPSAASSHEEENG